MRVSVSLVFAGLGLTVLIVGACGDPVSGDPVDIKGDWVLYDKVSASDIVCENTLLIFFFQKEHDIQGTFRLEGSCALAAGDTATEVGSGVLGNGSATTDGISFHAANCYYQGKLFRTPADSAAGAVTCDAQVNSVPKHLTGTWYANRRRSTS